MKQKFFLLLAALCVAMSSFASDDDLQVVSGDLSVISDPSITATVLFDYSKLYIEGQPKDEYLKSHGEEYVRDWPSQTVESEEYFIEKWNKTNKKGMKVSADAGKKYTLCFVVKTMDLGNSAASIVIGFGSGGAKMSGMMYVFEGDSKVPVLTVNIVKQTGRSRWTESRRRKDMYGELADDMLKALKAAKGKQLPAATEAVEVAGR